MAQLFFDNVSTLLHIPVVVYSMTFFGVPGDIIDKVCCRQPFHAIISIENELERRKWVIWKPEVHLAGASTRNQKLAAQSMSKYRSLPRLCP